MFFHYGQDIYGDSASDFDAIAFALSGLPSDLAHRLLHGTYSLFLYYRRRVLLHLDFSTSMCQAFGKALADESEPSLEG